MARPVKQGLDYFPMDVETDDKFELIEARHGITGFGVLVKLFQRIYKEGYYLKLSDELLLIFSKRINVDINKVNEIINDSIKYNIFSNDLNKKYNILSSTGIQKRFLSAVGRRKDVEMIKNYVIVDINLINADINLINADNSTQSKVKKRKEHIYDDLYSVFWDSYHSITGLKKTDNEAALKYWKKLTDEEKQKAYDNIKPYYDSLSDKKYCKKARTYLSDKNFNDEFKIVPKIVPSINPYKVREDYIEDPYLYKSNADK